jgi:addiction module RelE/StbE family toxin
MRELIATKGFLRSLRKTVVQNAVLGAHIQAVLAQLVENPFAAHLETHKLKGRLRQYWACSAGYDLRILFSFEKNSPQEDSIVLIDIGTHDEVY